MCGAWYVVPLGSHGEYPQWIPEISKYRKYRGILNSWERESNSFSLHHCQPAPPLWRSVQLFLSDQQDELQVSPGRYMAGCGLLSHQITIDVVALQCLWLLWPWCPLQQRQTGIIPGSLDPWLPWILAGSILLSLLWVSPGGRDWVEFNIDNSPPADRESGPGQLPGTPASCRSGTCPTTTTSTGRFWEWTSSAIADILLKQEQELYWSLHPKSHHHPPP